MSRSFLKFCETNPDAAQRHLERMGNKIGALKRRGICCHGWVQGPPGPICTDGAIKCLDCGAQFPNRAAHEEARQEAINS